MHFSLSLTHSLTFFLSLSAPLSQRWPLPPAPLSTVSLSLFSHSVSAAPKLQLRNVDVDTDASDQYDQSTNSAGLQLMIQKCDSQTQRKNDELRNDES